MDYSQYPDNWKWLSRQVRKRNEGRCELCFAPNGAIVWRDTMYEHPWHYRVGCGKKTRIILTVHHINSNKMDSSERNLISLCQRCHLRLDLQKHMDKRKGGNGKGAA